MRLGPVAGNEALAHGTAYVGKKPRRFPNCEARRHLPERPKQFPAEAEAICEGDALRAKEHDRGHIAGRSSACTPYHLRFGNLSLD